MNAFQLRVLVLLSVLCFFEMVGYMAITPSLIFYVEDLGGTHTQYGLILSACSLSSFCCMSLYASWVDSNGNQYRLPFLVGNTLLVLGNLLYFLAIKFVVEEEGASSSSTSSGIYVALLARCIYGMGAASGSISFTYIGAVFDHDDLTAASNYLSFAQFGGMAAGPLLNTIIGHIDTEWRLWGGRISLPINPHNSVGLVMAGIDFAMLVFLYFFLPEPAPKPTEVTHDDDATNRNNTGTTNEEGRNTKLGWWDVFHAVPSYINLWLPIFCIICLNANYSLIETAFAPAAAHGLGWGPVQISEVLGASSVVLAITTGVSMVVATRYQVHNSTMIIIGKLCWFIGGILLYILWTFPVSEQQSWRYIVPIFISFVGFPFIGAPARSIYTIEIASKKELVNIQARLQCVLAMSMEAACFITPLLVSKFVLRSSDDIEANRTVTTASGGVSDPHELTTWAWYVPITALLCIIGFVYADSLPKSTPHVAVAFESTALLAHDNASDTSRYNEDESTRKQQQQQQRKLALSTVRQTIAVINKSHEENTYHHRTSSSLTMTGMHIYTPTYETIDEKELSEELRKEEHNLEECIALDDDAEQ